MTGNGNHTNYGDDWGMVYSCYTHITNISVFLYTYVYSELSGEDGGLYVRHLRNQWLISRLSHQHCSMDL